MSNKQPLDASHVESNSGREVKRQKTASTPAYGSMEKGAALLQSGKWSDFKIRCRDHVFDVHRIVLSGQSDYFDRSIEGAFKESAEQELDLSAEEPLIVATILWFIYTQQFRLRDMSTVCELVKEATNPTTINTYILLVKIHKCASYLMLDQLSKIIFRKLADLLKHFFGSTGRTREEKNQHRPLFLHCVHHLFGSDESEEKVRDLFAWMITIMNDRRNKLFLLSDTHLDSILQTYPALGAYLYRSMAAQARLEQKCYDCETLMTREKVERWLIVEFDDATKLVRCSCSWRGLCSDECYSEESKIARGGARCTNCAKNVNVQQMYQRKTFYWEDGQIRLVQEDPLNSQEITADATGMVDSVVNID